MEDQSPIQKQQTARAKGIADVVFVIDSSGSMSPCFDGVKEHIRVFVEGVEADPQKTIDWRLGLLTENCQVFQKLDFTGDLSEFQKALDSASHQDWNEFTLPALDWAFDFDWRHGAHKVVVLMTDEPIDSGQDPSLQMSKIDELIQKMMALKIMLFIVGPECEAFKKLSGAPKVFYYIISGHRGFEEYDFSNEMSNMGKTVSRSVPIGLQQRPTQLAKKDIYGINGTIDIENL